MTESERTKKEEGGGEEGEEEDIVSQSVVIRNGVWESRNIIQCLGDVGSIFLNHVGRTNSVGIVQYHILATRLFVFNRYHLKLAGRGGKAGCLETRGEKEKLVRMLLIERKEKTIQMGERM